MEVGLSSGWVTAVVEKGEGGEGEGELPRRSDQPVLQVAILESVRSWPMQMQCLLKLSDGVHCVEGMPFSELNHLVIDGVLRDDAVVRVLDYICTTRQNRRFIVVRQVEIIKLQCRMIGSPQLYDKLESKSEESNARSVTGADLPFDESHSGGLSITSSHVSLGTVEGTNILEHIGTCDGSHSSEKGINGSSTASMADPVILTTVSQSKDENSGCSDNQKLLPCISSGRLEGANSLHNGTCDRSHSSEQSMVGSSIASMVEPVILKTVAQIMDENLGCSANQDLITVKAYLTYISTGNFCYAVCPLVVNGKQCNAKLTGNADGTWHCDICLKSFTPKSCDYRFVIVIQIRDASSMTWAFAFQEASEEIFGRTAKELYLMKYEEQGSAQFDDIIEGARFHQYLLKLKVERGAFDGKQFMKCTVIKAEKLDPPTEISEFGSSMAANTVSSNLIPRRTLKKKALSRAGTSNTKCTMSSGDARNQFSADRLGQLQRNAYGVMPAAIPAAQSIHACSTCGFALYWAQGTTAPQVWTEQQPIAEGFLYGSSQLCTEFKTVEDNGI